MRYSVAMCLLGTINSDEREYSSVNQLPKSIWEDKLVLKSSFISYKYNVNIVNMLFLTEALELYINSLHHENTVRSNKSTISKSAIIEKMKLYFIFLMRRVYSYYAILFVVIISVLFPNHSPIVA